MRTSYSKSQLIRLKTQLPVKEYSKMTKLEQIGQLIVEQTGRRNMYIQTVKDFQENANKLDAENKAKVEEINKKIDELIASITEEQND